MTRLKQHYSKKSYLKHYKKLIKLGIPIILGQLAMVLLGFSDTIMIGQYGTKELAASSFVNSIIMLPMLFIIGISLGAVPYIGASHAQGKHKKVGIILFNSLITNGFALIIASLFIGIILLFLPQLGQPKELLSYIKPYLLIQFYSFPFISLFYTFKQYTDSILETKISMLIIVIGVSTNIILNYLLIYGIGFFPELGLIGAGIATLIARVGMGISFPILFCLKKKHRSYFKGFLFFKRKNSILLDLRNTGIPIGLQMILEGGAFSISTLFAGFLGTISLATHQIIITISYLFFMIYSGIGSAIAVQISNYNGQKDIKNIKETAIAGRDLIYISLLLSCTIVVLFNSEIAALFTDNEKVTKIIPTLLLPLFLYQIGDATQITYINALRGIGYVKPIIIVCIISYIFLYIPMSYSLAILLNGGLQGLWYGFAPALTLAGISYYFLFKKRIKSLEARIK